MEGLTTAKMRVEEKHRKRRKAKKKSGKLEKKLVDSLSSGIINYSIVEEIENLLSGLEKGMVIFLDKDGVSARPTLLYALKKLKKKACLLTFEKNSKKEEKYDIFISFDADAMFFPAVNSLAKKKLVILVLPELPPGKHLVFEFPAVKEEEKYRYLLECGVEERRAKILSFYPAKLVSLFGEMVKKARRKGKVDYEKIFSAVFSLREEESDGEEGMTFWFEF